LIAADNLLTLGVAHDAAGRARQGPDDGGTRGGLMAIEAARAASLAVIAAADIVGYPRLMGRDERGTLAGLQDTRTQMKSIV